MEGKVKAIIDTRTIAVDVESKMQHPLYGKVLKRVKKFLVHVPEGVSTPKEGEMVEVFSSKPISKRKKWTIK
jgi:small subunit ribosomal protein S17